MGSDELRQTLRDAFLWSTIVDTIRAHAWADRPELEAMIWGLLDDPDNTNGRFILCDWLEEYASSTHDPVDEVIANAWRWYCQHVLNTDTIRLATRGFALDRYGESISVSRYWMRLSLGLCGPLKPLAMCAVFRHGTIHIRVGKHIEWQRVWETLHSRQHTVSLMELCYLSKIAQFDLTPKLVQALEHDINEPAIVSSKACSKIPIIISNYLDHEDKRIRKFYSTGEVK